MDFYLDLVASAETVSLLYHLATKVKTVRDAESFDQSEVRHMVEESHVMVLTLAIHQNMYAMSELAQELIKNRAHAHGWSIETYPGKVKLPSDIFKPLQNVERAKTVSAETRSF